MEKQLMERPTIRAENKVQQFLKGKIPTGISLFLATVLITSAIVINGDLASSAYGNETIAAVSTPQASNTNPPPTEAINACSGKAEGATCTFSDKGTPVTGVCNTKPGILACSGAKGQPGANQTPNAGGSTYNIEQAISDNAQLNTLAFDALGFLTGNTCSDSFLPPGKVADFFGFQYLRDTTQAGKGHSTDFVTNAANNVLSTLTDEQKAKMIALAKTQAALVNDFAYQRFPLMVAFRRELTGDIPTGTTGLSKTAVAQYSSELYTIDSQISIQRAQLFSEIIKSLSTSQVAFLETMVKGGFASWPSIGDQVDKQSLSHDEHVLVMTYASEMFGWYAGNVEADTYFCPERQGDYFGGFYIKDAPAMGNAGYTIDESITGDKGQQFIETLDATQKAIITGVVNTQRTAINAIVEKRRAIATEMRKALLTDGAIDQATVTALSKEYGQYDGEISYYYASAFAKVGKTLTTDQKAKLIAIKDLNDYSCPAESAFLYSEKIAMPTVKNTDFLFGTGSESTDTQDSGATEKIPNSVPDKALGYSAKWVSQTGSQALPADELYDVKPGDTITVTVTFENTGSKTWLQTPEDRQVCASVYKDQKVKSAPAGLNYDTPKHNNFGKSYFKSSTWKNNYRIGCLNETSVAPGAQGTFTLTFTIPADAPTAKFREDISLSSGPYWISANAPYGKRDDKGRAGTGDPLGIAHIWIGFDIQGRTAAVTTPTSSGVTFSLSNPDSTDGKTMAIENTCDGAGVSPALAWSGAPAETKEYALLMSTITPDNTTKWSWVLYGIPATTTSLEKNTTGIGTLGQGSHSTTLVYQPPCSQGPGEKVYTVTVYALSSSPTVPTDPKQVNGEVLTKALSNITLATATLNLSHSRG
ncbi:MAG: hypothetical protein WCP97_08550 [bacterium]